MITAISGCMFSGKSEELIRLLNRHELAEQRVIVFSPAFSSRRTGILSSRSGAHLSNSYTDYRVGPAQSAGDLLNLIETNNIEVVAFDEAQFFPDWLPELVDLLDKRGILVYISGLDRDFLGRPFLPMPEILALADRVVKLTAICTVCKKDANRTQRLLNGKPASKDDPLIVVGGVDDDRYEARCVKHHEAPD